MNCPECNSPTRITHSKRQPGRTKRTRACQSCPTKFITLDDGTGEVFLAHVAEFTKLEMETITKNYYQLVDTFSRAQLTDEWWQAIHTAMVNTKSRLGISGGKAGLKAHRGKPFINLKGRR
jgi:transcriptional regulator NrdR family protein